jgi:two-component system, OmpR family, phosphate regulon sensor histidine kinase PhoR
MNNLLRSSALKKFFQFTEFRAFVDVLSFGVIAILPNGQVTFANKLAQQICFKTPTDLNPFAPFRAVIHPKHKVVRSLIAEALKTKGNLTRQVEWEGKVYACEARVVVANKKCVGCMLIINDVTAMAHREGQHAIIYQISSALSEIGNLHHVVQVAVNQIIKVLPVTNVKIMLYDDYSRHLQIVADTGNAKHHITQLKVGEGAAGKCAQELKPVSIYDISNSDIYIKKRKKDKGAFLAVPIANKGRLLGILNVHDTTPRYFSEQEIQFLTIIANEIGSAIDNGILYEDLRRKVEILSELSYAASFSHASGFEGQIQQLVRLSGELLSAEGCYVYMYSAVKRKFVLRYRYGVDIDVPTEVSETDASRNRVLLSVYRDQQTIMINDVPRDYTKPERLIKLGIRNFISTPLYAGDEPIGILSVFNKRRGNFTSEDKQLIAITTQRIATKIENAKLLKRLANEKDILDKTVENINEGVVVLNRKRRIIIWNHYMAGLSELPEADALDQPSYKIFFSRLGLKKITRFIYSDPEKQKNISQPIEEILVRSDGSKLWIACSVSFDVSEDNKLRDMIIVIRNVTAEKALMRAKNEFLSLTTHELRTPLAAVKGYLSMARTPSVPVRAQKRYLDKAYEATERLVGLVEELFDVVRIDENRVELALEAISLHDLIKQCIENLSQKAQSKNIPLIHEADHDVVVWADRAKTQHIIDNLVDNAIKYTPARGTITLCAEARDTDAVIMIRDTGVGIPAHSYDRIFDRFIRVDNPLRIKAGGAGLGLYIVKNLVELQHGKVWLTSEVGKGSTFYFSLPLAPKFVSAPIHAKESS